MPSSRRQISVTAPTCRRRPRSRAGTRPPGRRTAGPPGSRAASAGRRVTGTGGRPSGGTGPERLAGDAERLPAGGEDRARPGRRPAARSREPGAGVDQVLAVVQHEQQPFAGRARRRARPTGSAAGGCRARMLPSSARLARAERGQHAPAAARPDRRPGASSTSQTPSGFSLGQAARPTRRPAGSCPRRPGPTRVTSRCLAPAAWPTRSTSASRPTKLVSGARRLVARPVASAAAGPDAARSTAQVDGGQLGGRVDAQLVGEGGGVLEGGQRVGLPAAPVQRPRSAGPPSRSRSGWRRLAPRSSARRRRRPSVRRPRPVLDRASRRSASRAACGRGRRRPRRRRRAACPRHSAQRLPRARRRPARGRRPAARARRAASRSNSTTSTVDVRRGVGGQPAGSRTG